MTDPLTPSTKDRTSKGQFVSKLVIQEREEAMSCLLNRKASTMIQQRRGLGNFDTGRVGFDFAVFLFSLIGRGVG
jgi:hypothetical protein